MTSPSNPSPAAPKAGASDPTIPALPPRTAEQLPSCPTPDEDEGPRRPPRAHSPERGSPFHSWRDNQGRERTALRNLKGILDGDPTTAPWLPPGWEGCYFPEESSLSGLRAYLDFACSLLHGVDLRLFEERRPSRMPSARQLLRNADLMVRQLQLSDYPWPSRGKMTPDDCLDALDELRAWVRASPAHRPVEAIPPTKPRRQRHRLAPAERVGTVL
jgi:hypothetical protein